MSSRTGAWIGRPKGVGVNEIWGRMNVGDREEKSRRRRVSRHIGIECALVDLKKLGLVDTY